MTDESKVKISSNEEIIDNLTKDLKNELNVNKEHVDTRQRPAEESVIGGSNIPNDFEESENEETETTLPDDYVDEVKLKDLEVSLTEDQKEERHKQALELKNKGNEEFKAENYTECIKLYTNGLRICPLKYNEDRAILYANRAACKSKFSTKESAIEDCTKAIELNPKYVKVYLRRAKIYEELDKLDESLQDYKTILELDPNNSEARTAQYRLPPLINERNEKLKTEMIGKLKDVGNMILRPFGLSTDNFQLQQDPNSGGYTVNFQQGPR